ncbi:caspase family protein [Sulfurimonas sp.]|nr:caspase family protein [Sulfurimonas sp.]
MKFILLLTIILLFSINNLQADRGLKLKEMKNEQRVALVIGNNNYVNLSKLKNPINDCRAMRDVLSNRGFDVIYKENASKRDMKKLLKKFAHKLKSGGVGLYYFAGHGVNVDGHNFLVGTDSVMDDKDEVEYETLALNYVTKKMKEASNRLNIVILDACRNDPFSRSGGGGLAPVSDAKGMFVAYATEAGSVASDGKKGKNGVFTKYLVKNLKEQGATIEKVFKNTRADVYDATDGKQSPGVYNQIRGDFYFTLPGGSSYTTSKVQTRKTINVKKKSLSKVMSEIQKVIDSIDNKFDTLISKAYTDKENAKVIKKFRKENAGFVERYLKLGNSTKDEALKAYADLLEINNTAKRFHCNLSPKTNTTCKIVRKQAAHYFDDRTKLHELTIFYSVANPARENKKYKELTNSIKNMIYANGKNEWDETKYGEDSIVFMHDNQMIFISIEKLLKRKYYKEPLVRVTIQIYE